MQYTLSIEAVASQSIQHQPSLWHFVGNLTLKKDSPSRKLRFETRMKAGSRPQVLIYPTQMQDNKDQWRHHLKIKGLQYYSKDVKKTKWSRNDIKGHRQIQGQLPFTLFDLDRHLSFDSAVEMVKNDLSQLEKRREYRNNFIAHYFRESDMQSNYNDI